MSLSNRVTMFLYDSFVKGKTPRDLEQAKAKLEYAMRKQDYREQAHHPLHLD